MTKFIRLEDLEVYRLAKRMSGLAWKIYECLCWEDKKVMGYQFIQAVDSVGANLAEGYKRYHRLDKIRFYYNSRGSLAEASIHWLELLFERRKISIEQKLEIKNISQELERKLENFIKSTYRMANE